MLNQTWYNYILIIYTNIITKVVVCGEITSTAKINPEQLVRERIKEIGYNDEKKGLNYSTCDIIISLSQQSTEISNAIFKNKKEDEIGAGDQGMMFGYATDETPELMPYTHLLASKLSEKLAEVRKNKVLNFLRPDGKTLVCMEYKTEDKSIIPVRVHSIIVSAQHDPDISMEELKASIMENVIKPVIPKELLDSSTQYFINPSGSFVTGGPEMDTGLSGKKLIVDTYGGWGSHGGKYNLFINRWFFQWKRLYKS